MLGFLGSDIQSQVRNNEIMHDDQENYDPAYLWRGLRPEDPSQYV